MPVMTEESPPYTPGRAGALPPMPSPVPAPYPGHSTVRDDWLDANGHMNIAHYVSAFDDGSCPMFDVIGLGWDYTEAGVGSIFVASSSIDFRRELLAGDAIRMTTTLVAFNRRRTHIYQEMYHAAEGYLAAQAEFVFAHVSLTTRRSADMPATALARLEQILAAHRSVPLPAFIGRAMGLDWRPAP